MDDYGLARQLDVVAGPVAHLNGVEAGSGPCDGDLRHPVIAGLGQRELLQRDGLGSIHCFVALPCRKPAQLVLVVRNSVLRQASVSRTGGPGAIGPTVAHHVPFVVVGQSISTGGVRQAKAVAHLMGDHGLVAVAPGWLPGRVPEAGPTVERGIAAAAPGGSIQLTVEHQVDADIVGIIDRSVGRGGAVAEELGQHAAGAQADVVGPVMGERVPTRRAASDDIDIVVRDLAPIVIQTRLCPADDAVEV